MDKIKSSIVIHQPHFCAWMPYYCRIACSETFVVLDDVPFRRHYYQDRTYLQDVHKNLIQINIPTHGNQNIRINQVVVKNLKYFISKFLKTLFLNYKKHRFFNELYEPLALKLKSIENEEYIYEINVALLIFFFDLLDIQIPIIKLSSSISDTNDRSQRIIDVCLNEGKQNILCGWGASREVHDLALIQSNGLNFIAISEEDFLKIDEDMQTIGGISIIDTIMSLGVKRTRSIFYKCYKLYQNNYDE